MRLPGAITPVAYESHCCGEYHGQHHAYEDDLDHANVPYMLPNTTAITMADMNMPAMIQNRSMLVPPVVHVVGGDLYHCQYGQCDQCS